MARNVFDPLTVQPYQAKRLDLPQGPNLNPMGYLHQARSSMLDNVMARKQGITLKEMEGEQQLADRSLANEGLLARQEVANEGLLAVEQERQALKNRQYDDDLKKVGQLKADYIKAWQDGNIEGVYNIMSQMTEKDVEWANKAGFSLANMQKVQSDTAYVDSLKRKTDLANEFESNILDEKTANALATYELDNTKSARDLELIKQNMNFITDPENLQTMTNYFNAQYSELPITNAMNQAQAAYSAAVAKKQEILNSRLEATDKDWEEYRKLNRAYVDLAMNGVRELQRIRDVGNNQIGAIAEKHHMLPVDTAGDNMYNSLREALLDSNQFSDQEASDIANQARPLIDQYVNRASASSAKPFGGKDYIFNPFGEGKFAEMMGNIGKVPVKKVGKGSAARYGRGRAQTIFEPAPGAPVKVRPQDVIYFLDRSLKQYDRGVFQQANDDFDKSVKGWREQSPLGALVEGSLQGLSFGLFGGFDRYTGDNIEKETKARLNAQQNVFTPGVNDSFYRGN